MSDVIDRILLSVCELHDGSALWEHTRRAPEAFRNAVRFALAGDLADLLLLEEILKAHARTCRNPFNDDLPKTPTADSGRALALVKRLIAAAKAS